MGFSIMSSSPNKDAAVRLLRFLTEDRERYVHDMAMYSMQAMQGPSGVAKEIPTDRLTVIIQEIERSVPASFFFSDTSIFGVNFHSESIYPLLKNIIDGRSASDALAQYAEQLDVFYSTFKEDPNAYGECIKSGRIECWSGS